MNDGSNLRKLLSETIYKNSLFLKFFTAGNQHYHNLSGFFPDADIYMAQDTGSQILIIGRNMPFFHQFSYIRNNLICQQMLNPALLCLYHPVGIFFINSGKYFALFTVRKRSINFMPVMKRIFHSDNRCQNSPSVFLRK